MTKSIRYGRFFLASNLMNIPLSTHKNLEIEICKGSEWRIFHCSFSWHRHVDHAGPQFHFEICKLFDFVIKIYDHRHWNQHKNRWYEPGEEEAERLSRPICYEG